MKTTVAIIGKNELELMTMADVTEHYNRVAKRIGLKAVKKFRDKPTAIARTLSAQETYAEDLKKFEAEQKKNAVTLKRPEPSEAEGELRGNKYGLTMDSIIDFKPEVYPKEGTIESALFSAITENYDPDLQENHASVALIVEYVIATHKRPRSEEPVDEAYVLHNIKWFIKKGHLTVEK